MKKIFVLLLYILFILSVTGCGTVVEQVTTNIEVNSEYNLLELFSTQKGYELSVNDDSVDITKVGAYKVSINATKNGKTKTYDYVVNVVDTIAPSYKISEEPLVFCTGDEVDFCDYVVVEDNSDVDIIPKFEKEFVDYNAAGEYKVNFTICDNSNNVSSGSLNFSIINYSVSEEIEIMGAMSNSKLSIASVVFKNIGTNNVKNIEFAYILYDENMMPTSSLYESFSYDNINLIPGEITTFTFARKNHTYAEFVVTKIEYEGGAQWEMVGIDSWYNEQIADKSTIRFETMESMYANLAENIELELNQKFEFSYEITPYRYSSDEFNIELMITNNSGKDINEIQVVGASYLGGVPYQNLTFNAMADLKNMYYNTLALPAVRDKVNNDGRVNYTMWDVLDNGEQEVKFLVKRIVYSDGTIEELENYKLLCWTTYRMKTKD